MKRLVIAGLLSAGLLVGMFALASAQTVQIDTVHANIYTGEVRHFPNGAPSGYVEVDLPETLHANPYTGRLYFLPNGAPGNYTPVVAGNGDLDVRWSQYTGVLSLSPTVTGYTL